MTFNSTLQLLLYMVVLIALAKPLGGYIVGRLWTNLTSMRRWHNAQCCSWWTKRGAVGVLGVG